MKRSEAVKQIEEIMRGYWADHIVPEAADQVLAALEARGVAAPGLTAKQVKGDKFPFGAGCSMRCDCSDCNPNYIIHQWEDE